MQGHSRVYRGQYRDFKGRLFLVMRHIQQLLVRWDNHCWGADTTKEMSQLSERCDGIGKIEGAVIAAREL